MSNPPACGTTETPFTNQFTNLNASTLDVTLGSVVTATVLINRLIDSVESGPEPVIVDGGGTDVLVGRLELKLKLELRQESQWRGWRCWRDKRHRSPVPSRLQGGCLWR